MKFRGSVLAASVLCAVGVFAAPSVSQAQSLVRTPQTIGPVRPYQVRLAVDLPVLGLAAVGVIVPQLVSSTIVSSCPCFSGDVLPIDRWTAGRRLDSVSFASDIALASLVASVPLFDLLDVRLSRGGWFEWLEDLLVIGQTVMINLAINQVTKIGMRRPRPRVYDVPAGDPLLAEPDNFLSFYSGHSSTIFSAGVALGMTYWFRHPESTVRALPMAIAVGAGLGVASMRVIAGKHFLSDVFVGALLGSVTGVLVPWVHRRLPNAQFAVSPVYVADTVSGAHIAFSMRF